MEYSRPKSKESRSRNEIAFVNAHRKSLQGLEFFSPPIYIYRGLLLATKRPQETQLINETGWQNQAIESGITLSRMSKPSAGFVAEGVEVTLIF
jgi:hypothetical protein